MKPFELDDRRDLWCDANRAAVAAGSEIVMDGRGRSNDVDGVSRSEYDIDFLRARGKNPRPLRGMRQISTAVVWFSKRIQESCVHGWSSVAFDFADLAGELGSLGDEGSL